MTHHADGCEGWNEGGTLSLLCGFLLTITATAFVALEGEGGGSQSDEEEGEEGGAHHWGERG